MEKQSHPNLPKSAIPRATTKEDKGTTSVFSRPIEPDNYVKDPIPVRLPFKDWLDYRKVPAERKPVIILPHVHTMQSFDAFGEYEDYVDTLHNYRLGGMIVTDHNHHGFCEGERKEPSDKPYLINGSEMICSYNGRTQGDLIGAFLKDMLKSEYGDDFGKIADDIHRKGGLVIIPHPNNDRVSGIRLQDLTEDELAKVDFIETHNARHFRENEQCRKRREMVVGFINDYNKTHAHKIRNIVGTDAHGTEELTKGLHMVAFEPHVNTPDKMKQALLNGEYHLLVHKKFK